MAYVLGYLYADGSLEDASYLRGKYVRVTSTDKGTIQKIRNWLDSKHTIVTLRPNKKHPGKTRYFLRIGSRVLYESLIKKGLYPKKSLTINFPKVPKKFLSDFTRGYFDGDGCVHLYTAKGITRKVIIKKLSIIFSSGSKVFLDGLSSALKNKLLLNQGKIYKNNGYFQLKYVTGDSIKIFGFMYIHCKPNHYLPRKFRIFEKYFKMNQRRKIDKRVSDILKGAVAK